MVTASKRKKKSPKKTAKTIFVSEDKCRNILESIDEGYYEVDLAGNYTFFNKSLCLLLGSPPEGIIGVNYRQYVDEENAKRLFKEFNKIYKTGEAAKVVDYVVKRKDGQKRYMETSASLLKDSSGKIIGFRGVVRDVTEYKESREALKISEEKYRTLLDNASDAIMLADEKGKLSEINKKAEELLGYTREELLGLSISKIHPREELNKTLEAFKKIRKNGSGFLNNAQILRKNNTRVFVDITGNMIEHGGQKILQGIFRDVTERKQMEDELRKSEQRYKNILESIREGYFELDLQGNYTFANEANCRYLGYTKKELIGKNYRIHASKEAAEKLYKPYRELYKTGKPIETLELESTTKDGRKVVHETSVSLIRDDGGKPIGFRGVSRDVTARKEMEKELRKSEEKYRTILENIEDGYYELDLDGNYTFFNDAEARNIGYTKEEMRGMNSSQYQDEETYKRTYKAFLEIYRTGETIKSLELELIRKDGTRTFSEISASLIRDEQGRPVGFRGITRDVNIRKKMEEDLRRSEERYRTILDDMEEGYFELDLAGNAVFFNDSACRISGYTREELMGMNYKQYMDKENQEKCFQIYSQIYKTDESGKLHEYEIIKEDKTKAYLESSISLVKDSSGKPIGFRGISRDITERKHAEEILRRNHEELIKKNKEIEEGRRNVQIALEQLGAAYEELKTSQAKILQQEKMASIGQLAAGVAHEINNPISFISSNLITFNKYISRLVDFVRAQEEAIKKLTSANEIDKLEKIRKKLKIDYVINDAKKLLQESLDGTDRVQNIVQGLNRFSRFDDSDYRVTDLNECMEQSINIVWNEMKYKVTLQKDYGKIPATKCFSQQISQVFVNLLLNAVQSIADKGEIKIKTWEQNGEILITVSDTGVGISPAGLDKLFEPFFTTKEVGKGTGLGLSISYEIIQRHKGDISFESVRGKGTTFTVKIPVVP